MKKIRDGWHKIAGYEVYTEDGYILRGIKKDHNGSQVTAWVYKLANYGGDSGYGWFRWERMTPDAFRAGVKRGTVRLA